MFEKYQNREFKHCYTMGQRVNFNWDGTISLCHGVEVGDYVIGKSGKINFSAEWYEKTVSEILNRCICNEDILCKNCSNFKKGKYENNGINVITINTASLCNCKCIYCSTWSKKNNYMYDPLPYIEKLVEAGVVNENCFFDWGGGEPTLNRYFEETFNYIEEHNFVQRVNTNALKYSDFLMQAMNRGNCLLRISLDAGDAETFFNVKGIDVFEETCDNIARYSCKNEDRVTIKYVMNSANKSKKSIEGFIDFCNKLKIRNIILDADLNSYALSNYNGPLFFTGEELIAAHYFQDYSESKGLEISIGYVYTAGTNIEGRDYNFMGGKVKACYMLPNKTPMQKLEKNIITNGITIKAFASIEAMKIRNRMCVAYVDGIIGQIEKRALIKNGIKLSRIVRTSKKFDEIEELLLYALKNEQCIVLCTPDYKKILKMINDKSLNIENARDIQVIAMDDYRYIEKQKNYKLLCFLMKVIRKLHFHFK